MKKEVKKFEIEFIETPDLFCEKELENIKGGTSCFIQGCECKSASKTVNPGGSK